MNNQIAVVFGTRPETIKLAPVIHQLGSQADCVYTGQHYDPTLADEIFASARLAPPEHRLTGIGGRSRSEQIVGMLEQLDGWLRVNRPAAVIVQGDTNSAWAGAQAAHYLGIPVLHVEAGLRSYDRDMPEELNRMLIGTVADVHCCPTPGNAANLLRLGVDPGSVHVTGNTVVEATRAALPDLDGQHAILRDFGVLPETYVLATVHRPENADDPDRLAKVLSELAKLGHPVLLPLHPRTLHQARRHGIELPPALRAVAPIDHVRFLSLAAHARLLVSDSGGVQEETTVLGKPLVVVRQSTERPEAMTAGFAELTGPDGIGAAAGRLLRDGWPERLRALPSPFGDGQASRRIAELTRGLVAAPSEMLATTG